VTTNGLFLLGPIKKTNALGTRIMLTELKDTTTFGC